MKKIIIFLMVLIANSLLVSAYTLNYAKTKTITPSINETVMPKFISNIKLIEQVKNISCMEYPSEGIQGGCAIFKQKTLELLGVPKPKFSVLPKYVSPYTKRMLCYPDMGGFTEYGPGYHIVLMHNGFEIDLNRTIYPMGVRVYERKNKLVKNNTEVEYYGY